MHATGTFKVVNFVPTAVKVAQEIETALPVGVSILEKEYEGDIAGRSTTIFTAAYEQASGVGTYVAMESFDGSLHDRSGSFNFVHSAATDGVSRDNVFFAIVASSGTRELTGISGTGGLDIDEDGVHRMWFDYELD
jgi:hypothetical protein